MLFRDTEIPEFPLELPVGGFQELMNVLTALQKSLTASRSTAVIAWASRFVFNQNKSKPQSQKGERKQGNVRVVQTWTPISSEDCLLFLWKMLNGMSLKRTKKGKYVEYKPVFTDLASFEVYCLFLKFSLCHSIRHSGRKGNRTHSLLPLGNNGFSMS